MLLNDAQRAGELHRDCDLQNTRCKLDKRLAEAFIQHQRSCASFGTASTPKTSSISSAAFHHRSKSLFCRSSTASEQLFTIDAPLGIDQTNIFRKHEGTHHRLVLLQLHEAALFPTYLLFVTLLFPLCSSSLWFTLRSSFCSIRLRSRSLTCSTNVMFSNLRGFFSASTCLSSVLFSSSPKSSFSFVELITERLRSFLCFLVEVPSRFHLRLLRQ